MRISIFFLLSLFLSIVSSHAATFEVGNNCPFTVWAAAVPGGGKQLNPTEVWKFNVNPGTTGRIWARTNCHFNESGRGRCETGGCGGFLECRSNGAAPITLAQYTSNHDNDFFNISLNKGFNVPIKITPTSNGCTVSIGCAANINDECPTGLRSPGGCNNPCTVYKTDMFCCISGRCEPTVYSMFFKERCPDASSYPKDDQSRTVACPTGTNYSVVFCP